MERDMRAISANESLYQESCVRGGKIFAALEEKSARKDYDDSFLQLLVEYRALFPQSENFDIFYARYALFHESFEVARDTLEQAYRKKKCHYEIWKSLIECCRHFGDVRRQLILEGIASHIYRLPIEVAIPREQFSEYLDLLSLAMGEPVYAPIAKSRAHLADGVLADEIGVFAGEFLPMLEESRADLRYWVGAYIGQGGLNNKGLLLEMYKEDPRFCAIGGADFVFDVLRARLVPESITLDEDEEVFLPLIGTEETQEIRLAPVGEEGGSVFLGKWATNFYRISEKTQISSEHPFLTGKPIPLRHSPQRKKLVLHILADGFSWTAMKQHGYALMPNLMRFFLKGTIFDQHFSVAEYTYPSLATIETGCHLHRLQSFNENCMNELDSSFVTLSEQMKALGYYCTNVMGDGNGIYNGATRGHDRLIVNAWDLSASEGVRRTIGSLKAFAPCDQFVFLHFTDMHPWPSRSSAMPLPVQTGASLADCIQGAKAALPSVYLPNEPIFAAAARENMASVDESLGLLFSYIEEHYGEDEYIIQLYSDHGSAVLVDEPQYLMGAAQTGAAWMLRGAGVPQLGVVDELTSALDIYPAAARLAGFTAPAHIDGNLPAALGGEARDHVISNSIFPGQTYKLCIRTREHEFRLESQEVVDEDGSVDLRRPKMQLFRRADMTREIEDRERLAHFLAIARAHTASFDTRGEIWQEKRALRKSWFG